MVIKPKHVTTGIQVLGLAAVLVAMTYAIATIHPMLALAADGVVLFAIAAAIDERRS